MSPQLLRITLLQMDIAIGQPEVNFSKLSELLEQAVTTPDHPDVLVFPEMWNTGYALEQIQQLADVNGERTKAMLSSFCRKYKVNIIAGSIAEKNGTNVRNTVYVFDRKGNVTTDYSKIHLFRLMDEDKYLVSGDRIGDTVVDGIRSGVMICYDIRFPELSRKHALNGAKIMFVPAEWPKPRLHHWRTLLMARAIENQMFVVACNRVGISGTTEFFGHSMVVNPWGDIVAEGGEEEEIISFSIDISEVDKVRGTIPIFEDRRPSLY